MSSPTEIAGRFVLEALAGTGGMGAVYRARDRDGQLVAVKLLAPSADAHRFAREASLLSELRHDAIVRYVAHGVSEGRPFLAMEWLEGQDLASRLAEGPLAIDECVTLGARIASALAHAHARGVVHRDVKPSNVFLEGGDVRRARLVDFGIARDVSALSALTRTGAIIGTPSYMAPEQARGESSIDARVDVFALGCVLHESLTTRPAFHGPNAMAVLCKILLEEAPPLARERPDVPAALDRLIARMIAKDVSVRPPDGRAVVAALGGLGDEPPAVSAPPPSRGVGTSEQRFVTLLLARTAHVRAQESVDTLAAEEALPLLAHVRSAVGPVETQVVPMLDGSVVAVLTDMPSATDQAAHAARAALRLRGALPNLVVTIASGRAEMAGRVPIGEAIDRAAALHEAPRAATGARVDELTAGLLGAEFVVAGDDGGLVLAAEREAFDEPRTLLGRPTACVGREKELAYLTALFEDCAADRVATAAVVTAPPGTGKSRLRQEIGRTLASRSSVWLARADPLSGSSTLGLLARLLRGALGVVEGEAPDVARRKVEARVARRVPEARVAEVAAFLAELLDVGEPEIVLPALRAARADPLLMGEGVLRAWVELVEHEAAAGPLVILLEDVHWADRASIDAVQHALRTAARAPLLLLAFARPEVVASNAGAWAGVQEIPLRGLGARASERLVRDALGQDLEAAVVTRLIELAGGNAFYLEELVRAQAAGSSPDTMPSTVVAMAHARLASLDAGDRRILRVASIVGEIFWTSSVRALLGDAEGAEVEARLASLADRELVTRHAAARFAGERELAFRHALVREAAYATLTREDALLGHQLAAEWLERVGERDAAILARHHELGGQLDRATDWYRKAAEHALEGNDLGAALEAAERAIGCGAAGATLGALRLVQASVLDWRGENAEAARFARDAVALLEPASAAWYRATTTVATSCRRMGDHAGLAAVAATLLAHARFEQGPVPERGVIGSLGRTALQLSVSGAAPLGRALLDRIEPLDALVRGVAPVEWAWLRAAGGVHAVIAGDPSRLLADADEIVAVAAAAGDVRTECNFRFYVGAAAQSAGDFALCEHWLGELAARTEKHGLFTLRINARKDLALALVELGRADQALPSALAAVDDARSQRDRFQECTACQTAAAALLALGRLDEACVYARAAQELVDSAPPFRARVIATLGRVLVSQGRGELALTELASVDRGAMGYDDMLLALARVEALASLGRDEEARRTALDALARLGELARAVASARVRETLLTQPLHARLVAYASRAP